MACINFATCEDGESSEFRSSGGSWSNQTTIVLSGTRSIRFAPVGSAVANARLALIRPDGRRDTEFNTANCYTQVRLHIVTAPASNQEKIIEFADTGGSTKAFVALNSSRQLEFYNNAGGLVATGATSLSLNTTYFIQVRTSTGSGNQPYEVHIDEVLELSGTANQLTNNHGSVYFGKRDNLNSQTMDIVMDCFYCDDSTFIGDGEVAGLTPTANGSVAQWTSGTGASNYTQVDEIPPSTADYIQSAASSNQSHYVELEDCATVGITGTIQAFKATAFLREVSSGTSSNKLRISSGASNLDTTAFNHSTSNVHIQLLAEEDPDTSAPWTLSGIDALEIGVIEANAIAMRCFYMHGYVYYFPAPPPSGPPIEYINMI